MRNQKVNTNEAYQAYIEEDDAKQIDICWAEYFEDIAVRAATVESEEEAMWAEYEASNRPKADDMSMVLEEAAALYEFMHSDGIDDTEETEDTENNARGRARRRKKTAFKKRHYAEKLQVATCAILGESRDALNFYGGMKVMGKGRYPTYHETHNSKFQHYKNFLITCKHNCK